MAVGACIKATAFSTGGIYRGKGRVRHFQKRQLKVFIIEAKIAELKLGLTSIYLEICNICSNRLSRWIFFTVGPAQVYFDVSIKVIILYRHYVT